MATSSFQIRSCCGGSITAVDARSGRCFARHSHEEFGIGLITHGAQRSWSGRGVVEAVRGDIITVNPSETHDGAPIGAERRWSMLYLSPAMVGALVSDLSEGRQSNREWHRPVIADRRVAQLFVAARAAALGADASDALDERLLMLLGLIAGDRSAPAMVPRCLKQVRDRIDADPAALHPLAELATLAGLSRFQTVRGFARLTGLTPHAYLVQRRLDLARRMIRDGLPLAHASADAGFADQSHMHRTFVARYGYAPGAYAIAMHRRPAISFKRAKPVLR